MGAHILARLLAAIFTLTTFAAFAGTPRNTYRHGEILIKLKGPTGAAHAFEQNKIAQAFFDKVNTSENLHLIRTWNGMNLHHMRYDSTKNPKAMADVLADLAAMPEVEYAEPNYVVTKAEVTDSSGGVPEYSLSEVQSMSSGGSDPMTTAAIQLTSTWPVLSTSLAKAVVAVIDTGLDFTHPAFANSIWTNPGEIPNNGIDDDQDGYVDDVHGWNFAYSNNTPQDDEGHGTHVSGIVLGMGQNIFTSPAPASNVYIMPLKFLDSTGSGSTSDAISAIYYAISKGARVMNNSWGGGAYSQALAEAIAYAYSQDVLFVAAAGNSTNDNDTNPSYPAAYQIPNVVAVAASDNSDVIAYFSNYGTQTVPLSAPGVNILSTYPGGLYATMSGTSMASPFVAGVAALMRYQNPAMNCYQIKQLILSGADKVTDLSTYVTTSARVDVLNSVQASMTTPVSSYMPAFALSANGGSGLGSSLDARGGGCGLVGVLGKDQGNNNDRMGRLKQVVVTLALFLIPVVVIQGLRRRQAGPARRRKHERFMLDSAVTFKIGDQELVGAVKTISVGGSDLNTEALLKEGSIITMSISGPDGSSQIQVQGHIVWSEKQKRYGVAFDSVSEGIKAQIREWQKGLKTAA